MTPINEKRVNDIINSLPLRFPDRWPILRSGSKTFETIRHQAKRVILLELQMALTYCHDLSEAHTVISYLLCDPYHARGPCEDEEE